MFSWLQALIPHQGLTKNKAKTRRVQLQVETLESRDTPSLPPGSNIIWRNYTAANAFSLHSNPGARHVVYMDFDGHTVTGTQWNTSWNNGNAITMQAWSMDGNRASFSNTELTTIINLWREVAEDFAPFEIDVTTQDPGVEALRKTSASDTNWGIRALIGPPPTLSNAPSGWPPGGVAYLGSFNWNSDTPCFNFNGDSSSNPQVSLPMTVSHEVGHTLGLTHDGTASLGYYPGHGTGAVGWGPIMGAPFGQNLVQWSRGQYPGANNTEDDLQVITTGNGFGYRRDDFGNTSVAGNVGALNKPFQGTLTRSYGVIERNTDSDYFSFYANPGNISINVNPIAIGPNLDIRADLYNSAGALISSSNPLDQLNATFNLNLAKGGRYFLKISGTGRPDPNGYTNYGSLGNFEISGTVEPYTAIPVQIRNPLRWTYNPFTGVYTGQISILSNAFSVPNFFALKIQLPHASMSIVGATQTGRIAQLPIRGGLTQGVAFHYTLQIRNPMRLALPTYFQGFVITM